MDTYTCLHPVFDPPRPSPYNARPLSSVYMLHTHTHRVLLKGMTQKYRWVIHIRTMKEGDMNMGPRTPPVRLTALFTLPRFPTRRLRLLLPLRFRRGNFLETVQRVSPLSAPGHFYTSQKQMHAQNFLDWTGLTLKMSARWYSYTL